MRPTTTTPTTSSCTITVLDSWDSDTRVPTGSELSKYDYHTSYAEENPVVFTMVQGTFKLYGSMEIQPGSVLNLTLGDGTAWFQLDSFYLSQIYDDTIVDCDDSDWDWYDGGFFNYDDYECM